jgi:hypothetical protein
MAAGRWPVQDLFDITKLNPTQLANLVGVDVATAWRWRDRNALLDDYEADRIAVLCDLHPIEVWGPAYIDVVASEPETPSLFEDACWGVPA